MSILDALQAKVNAVDSSTPMSEILQLMYNVKEHPYKNQYDSAGLMPLDSAFVGSMAYAENRNAMYMLVGVDSGWKLIDSDLSGIELRLFAHYLARYDGGRYAKILLEQDIHQVNADKIGISRRQVKTITYCFLYGGGNQKLGLSYDNMLSPEAAKKKGAEIRRAYLDAVEGLEDLVNATRRVAEGGSIRAIDKRPIIVDKEHKALNCLLQGSAAVIAKRWLLLTHQNLGHLTHERYAFVHDEQVLGAPAANAEEVANVCKLSALQAGEYYNIRLPIEADAQVGDNWHEVH